MTTLSAFYDLAVGPVSFDFVVFLVKAEIERKRIGATRLHIIIVPDPNGPGGFRDKSQFYDQHEAHFRLWNILIPAPQLFGASVTLALDWLQARRLASDKEWKCWPSDWDHQTLKDRRHLVGDLIAAARAGTPIPHVKPSEYACRAVKECYEKFRRPVVTMTLRSTYLAERNSDRAAWEEARRHVEARGFAVVVLDDTRVALQRGSGFGELNLDLRAAMYQEAALNLHANSGAASLSWFSERPYRMFGAGVPAEEWDGLFVKQGLPLGSSWPWASEGQRIVYGRTTREQIVAEFEDWARSRRAGEASSAGVTSSS